MNSFPLRYIGRPHIYFESIDSTNTYAMDLITKSAPTEGTVISAGYQSRGRGQIGRDWDGEENKNIYSTIILKPDFIKPNDQFCLNQAIALGVSSLIEEYLEKTILIKWPNDIYVEDRKISGILIQNVLDGKRLSHTAAGIGINVNQEVFPVDLPNPTSFYLETGKVFPLDQMLQGLFFFIEYWYEQLRSGNRELIRRTYLENLYRLGETTTFVIDGQYKNGKITGVDERGKLLLECEGTSRMFGFNELKMMI